MARELYYPTDSKGLAIPAFELDLPESRIPTELLDEGEPYVNNHHRYYIARLFGRSVLTHTFRQLEEHIDPLPIDTHRIVHQRWQGVPIPPDTIMMDMIEEAYANNGRIMSGNSSKKPVLINEDRMKRVRSNYNERRRYGK